MIDTLKFHKIESIDVQGLLENKEPLESDVLDRPDVDPLEWLHAMRAETSQKYPTREAMKKEEERLMRYVTWEE
jgi:hypothetical protein